MVNEKIREMRDKKSYLLNQINDYVYENNMKETKIEITDGELLFCERKEYAPLTYKYLEECLQNVISDESHVAFHCVKGRQRPYVFVVGFNQSYMSYFARNMDQNRCPNTLYVATTRATQRLF